MPERYWVLASAALEPEVARFVEDVTTSTEGFDLQQYPARPLAGSTVKAAREKLGADGGPLLVGLAVPEGGGYRVMPNPESDRLPGEGDQLIVIANREQAERAKGRFGLRQGR